MATSVFVSYHHGDALTAECVRSQLYELANHGSGAANLCVFLDIESVPAGSAWKPTIDAGLKRCDWLLVLYTGEQSDYVGYEVGSFEQMHMGTVDQEREAHITCIYDVDPGSIPATLTDRQNVSVPPVTTASKQDVVLTAGEAAALQASELGRLLTRICAEDELYTPKHEATEAEFTNRIALSVKVVANAFALQRGADLRSETPAQIGFELEIQASAERITAIPDDATLIGTSLAFSVLDLNLPWDKFKAPNTTWGELKRLLSPDATVPWMRKVEKDVLRAIASRNVSRDSISFLGADQRVYHPVLVRHQLFFNGSRKFFILMVAIPSRRFVGFKTSSLLLTGLILASRWRFTYFEKWDETISVLFGEETPLEAFDDACKQLLYNVEWIENEALEYGATDQETFVGAFGPEQKARSERFFTDWARERDRLREQFVTLGPRMAENRTAVRGIALAFLESTRRQNADFLDLCVRKYYDYVMQELGNSSESERASEIVPKEPMERQKPLS